LLRIDGCNLHLRGIDLIDGTPILDVKSIGIMEVWRPQAGHGFRG
jgi:tRNA (Thr-GGU) A37 N-methylase